MDYTRSREVRQLKEFIIREGESRKSIEIQRDNLQGMKATGIPFQDTISDCGVYLLGYMEKFLKNPRDMITKVLQRELSAARDWPELDAIKMRAQIRDVIFKVHEEQEDKKRSQKKIVKATPKAPKQNSSQAVSSQQKLAANRHSDGTIATQSAESSKVQFEEQGPSSEEHTRQWKHGKTRREPLEINEDHHYKFLENLLMDVHRTKCLEILNRLHSENYVHPQSPREFGYEYLPEALVDEEILDIFKCCTLEEIERFKDDMGLSLHLLARADPGDNQSSILRTPKQPLASKVKPRTRFPSPAAATKEQQSSAPEDDRSDDGVQFVSARTTSPVAGRPKRKRRSSSERLKDMIWNSNDRLDDRVIMSPSTSFARLTRSSQQKEKLSW